jgi:hypothetical protein
MPFIFLAFNIRWVTTPWNYLRHIGIKVLLVILLRPLRNSKSLIVGFRGAVWTAELIKSLMDYEYTSQPERAWRMQVFRTALPESMRKAFDEKVSGDAEFPGLDEDTNTDTGDSSDEDMEKKTALLKHLGGVYKKPRRRKLS